MSRLLLLSQETQRLPNFTLKSPYRFWQDSGSCNADRTIIASVQPTSRQIEAEPKRRTSTPKPSDKVPPLTLYVRRWGQTTTSFKKCHSGLPGALRGHSENTHRNWQRTPVSLVSAEGIVTHVRLMCWNVLGFGRSDPYKLTN